MKLTKELIEDCVITHTVEMNDFPAQEKHRKDCGCNDCREPQDKTYPCFCCGLDYFETGVVEIDERYCCKSCLWEYMKKTHGVQQDSEPLRGHPAFLSILDEIRALHLKKAADYGTHEDCLANMRSDDFGVEAWRYAVLQCKNKMKRLQAYCQNGKLANEGVEDSMLDLAAYAIIALVLKREASK